MSKRSQHGTGCDGPSGWQAWAQSVPPATRLPHGSPNGRFLAGVAERQPSTPCGQPCRTIHRSRDSVRQWQPCVGDRGRLHAHRTVCPRLAKRSEGERLGMAQKVVGFHLWLHYEGPEAYKRLVIAYTPLARDAEGQESRIEALGTQMSKSSGELEPRLKQKLSRVWDYAESRLPSTEVEIAGEVLKGA